MMPRASLTLAAAILVTAAAPLWGQSAHKSQVKPKSTTGLYDALTEQQRPFSERNVVALQGDQVVRLTPENAAPVLSQTKFAAEKLEGGPRMYALPAEFADKVQGVKEGFLLPTRYTSVRTANEGAISFNVVLVIVNALHYDAQQGQFAGAFALSLINPSDPNDHATLAQQFPITIRADAATLSPQGVVFSALQVPQTVQLVVRAPKDPYLVQAYTVLTQNPESIAIPVQHVAIQLLPASNHIRGLGLESTDVNVIVEAARGRTGEMVSIQASQGRVTPSSIRLDTNGGGKVVLQSAALGTSMMTASDPPFDNGSAQVTFDWPIAFALATVLGGIVGALLRPDVRTHWRQSLLIGVLAAIVLCVAHAVGVTLSFWSTPSGAAGEATFFVIAAIAGFLGRRVMTLLTKGSAGTAGS